MLVKAAFKAITPLAIATKRAIQDWGKRVNKGVDFDIDQHITKTTDPTFKATGFRETMTGKILDKLGMLPEFKNLNRPIDPMLQGWYDDYVLKGKSIEGRVLDDTKLFSPTERALYDAHMREGKTAEEALELTLDAITSKDELIADWLPGFKKSIDDTITDSKVLQLSADEFYAMNTKMQDRLLNTSGLSKKDLDVYHWISEARDMQVAMLQLSRELGEGADSPLSREIALSIKEKDLAVFEAQLDTKSDVFNALERLHSDKFAEFVQRGYDYSLSQMETNLTNPLLTATKSDPLPTNVTQLPGTKPIQDMTWREWDDLSDSPFTLSSKQNEMMKAQGINKADDVLDHFWGKGARKDFEGWLLDAKAKQRLSDDAFQSKYAEELEFMRERDLKSGYMDAISDDELATDMAWKFLGEEFDQGFVKFGKNPLAVAQKMAWKPDNVSHEHWAQFTEKMTMKEVENAYRRLTLTLID